MTTIRTDPIAAAGWEARTARDRLRDSASALDRARLAAADHPELQNLATDALAAAEVALIRVGELRHRLAETAMLNGYGRSTAAAEPRAGT